MGEHRVGTSSLLRRFNLGLFNEQHTPEVGKVMRHTKNVYYAAQGCYVTVQFWDIEGGDIRTGCTCALKAHAVAVVYDITNRTSFERAQDYLDGINPRASSLLIGNKMDLQEQRKVSYEEGRLLARIHRVEFIETSAKINYNIDEAFQMFVTCVPKEYLLNLGSSTPSHQWRMAATAATLCTLCTKKIKRHHADRYVFDSDLSEESEEQIKHKRPERVRHLSAESLPHSNDVMKHEAHHNRIQEIQNEHPGKRTNGHATQRHINKQSSLLEQGRSGHSTQHIDNPCNEKSNAIKHERLASYPNSSTQSIKDAAVNGNSQKMDNGGSLKNRTNSPSGRLDKVVSLRNRTSISSHSDMQDNGDSLQNRTVNHSKRRPNYDAHSTSIKRDSSNHSTRTRLDSDGHSNKNRLDSDRLRQDDHSEHHSRTRARHTSSTSSSDGKMKAIRNAHHY